MLFFIARTLFACPSSLLLEGFALSLLALAALTVEISADASASLSLFNTRPGVSSGILLGAITLPVVILTRLIQLWRAFSLHEISLEEFEYLKVQYWAASACCVSVLLVLCLVIWSSQSSNNSGSACLNSLWVVKVTLSCIILYAALCCVSLSTRSHSDLLTALKLVWVPLHGLAAVKLIHHALKTFPACVSIGEALLVTGGLVLYFGDMLAFTLAKIHGCLIASEQLNVQYGIKRSETHTVIQGLLLGLLLFPMIFKFEFQISKRLRISACPEERISTEIGKSLIFFISLGFILIAIVPLWMQFVQDFDGHPFFWVFVFVFSEPFKRLSICIYWVVVICASVLRFYNISKNSMIERILLRKYYHLMAVCMFLPALIFQPEFLNLAFGVALAVFLALEIIRVWRIWPLGQHLHQFMNAFTDHRDSDVLIVSHFSLLLGCALPIWMCSGYNDRPLAPFAGILSLGIGDSMASVVGHKYGVLRWSKNGKKTIEGTAAGITSVLVACSVILQLLASTGYIVSQHWLSLLVAVIVSGLLEAYTAQLDNAFIPLVFYSLLCL